MTRARKLLVAALALVVVLGLAVAIVFGLLSHDESESSGGATSTPTPTVVEAGTKLMPKNARTLETLLVSSDKTERDSAWVPRMRGGRWRAAPAGTRVSIYEEKTFKSYGTYGRVDAVVSGPIQNRIIIHLEYIAKDKQWFVLGMEER